MSKTLEELGYTKINEDLYTKKTDWETIEIFFTNKKVICQSKNKYALDYDPWESKFIDMEELKAIYKWCEDNKWI